MAPGPAPPLAAQFQGLEVYLCRIAGFSPGWGQGQGRSVCGRMCVIISRLAYNGDTLPPWTVPYLLPHLLCFFLVLASVLSTATSMRLLSVLLSGG